MVALITSEADVTYWDRAKCNVNHAPLCLFGPSYNQIDI